jgi:ABC-type multidrug transport system fused ATPase/permease subunit
LFWQGRCFCPNRWGPPAPVAGEIRNVGLEGVSRQSSEDSVSMLGRPVTYAVDLAWHHLAISVTDPDTHTVKQILYPSSGVVLPGEMCALVGPSGAGTDANWTSLLACILESGGIRHGNGRLLLAFCN